jgi:CTP synthase (UTP-ammonia lyase)
MSHARIALIGDFNPDVLAHRAINECFALGGHPSPVWLPTETIVPGEEQRLKEFQGFWCVPASPYRNTGGALAAIQYARTRLVPFLGTCGGFQHALLEYARNVLGLHNASHAEIDSQGGLMLLTKLSCPLAEQTRRITTTSEPFKRIYGSDSGSEGFHCSYGLNPDLEHLFNNSALEIVARSDEGEARAFMLKQHPFFVGTLFQPERKALTGSLHPVVKSFFAAAGG